MMGNSMSKEQKDEIKRKDREREKASKEAAKLKEQNTVKPKYKNPCGGQGGGGRAEPCLQGQGGAEEQDHLLLIQDGHQCHLC